MKSFALFFIAAIAVAASGHCAEAGSGSVLHRESVAASCYASPQAVWRDHPQSHAAYRIVDGRQCWRAGYPSTHVSRGRRDWNDGMIVSAPPLPRARPELEVLHPQIYPRMPPAYGRVLSRELLGE